jgi:hypothetical protein
MDILQTAYPRYYKDVTPQESRNAVNLWTEMFADDDVKMVAVTVKALITSRTSNFPPVIGEVKEQMYKLTRPNEMTATEARGLVRKALSNGYYGSEEEFKKLPPTIQSVLGSASVLREWSMMDGVSVSVALTQFEKGFNSRSASMKEFAKLPADIQKLSLELSEKMQLGNNRAKELAIENIKI